MSGEGCFGGIEITVVAGFVKQPDVFDCPDSGLGEPRQGHLIGVGAVEKCPALK